MAVFCVLESSPIALGQGEVVLNPIAVLASGTDTIAGVSQSASDVYFNAPGGTVGLNKIDPSNADTVGSNNFFVIDTGSYGDDYTLKLASDGNIYVTSNLDNSLANRIFVGTQFTGVGDFSLDAGVAGLRTVDKLYTFNPVTGVKIEVGSLTGLDVSPVGLGSYGATGAGSAVDLQFLVPLGPRAGFIDLNPYTNSSTVFDASFLNTYYANPTLVLQDVLVDGFNVFVAYNQPLGGTTGTLALFDGFTPTSGYVPNLKIAYNGAGEAQISFETVNGRAITLQRSVDLILWEDRTTIIGTGARYTHLTPLTSPREFFRLTYGR